jgi:hypothetical protein
MPSTRVVSGNSKSTLYIRRTFQHSLDPRAEHLWLDGTGVYGTNRHETHHTVSVLRGNDTSHRSSHRVASHHKLLDAQRVHEADGIIGKSIQCELLALRLAPTSAVTVERDASEFWG